MLQYPLLQIFYLHTVEYTNCDDRLKFFGLLCVELRALVTIFYHGLISCAMQIADYFEGQKRSFFKAVYYNCKLTDNDYPLYFTI